MTEPSTDMLEFTVAGHGYGRDKRHREIRVSVGGGVTAHLSITVEGESRVSTQIRVSAVYGLLEALVQAYERSTANLDRMRAEFDAEAAAVAGAPSLAERVRDANNAFAELLDELEVAS